MGRPPTTAQSRRGGPGGDRRDRPHQSRHKAEHGGSSEPGWVGSEPASSREGAAWEQGQTKWPQDQLHQIQASREGGEVLWGGGPE